MAESFRPLGASRVIEKFCWARVEDVAYVRTARSTPGVELERSSGVMSGVIQLPLVLKFRKVGMEDMAWRRAALRVGYVRPKDWEPGSCEAVNRRG